MRAPTHAGAELCVPADRLASTLTQAAPAAQMPTMAMASIGVMATSRLATANTSDAGIDQRIERDALQMAWDRKPRR